MPSPESNSSNELAPTPAATRRPPPPSMAARPNVPEVRSKVPAQIRGRSALRGIAVFVFVGTLYGLTLCGALAAPHWPLQLLSCLANSLLIGTFFTVGHDACHHSLTPSTRLNQVLGRLAFLPSLTPYITWEYAHNRIHHSYTNWRGKDYVWAPFSKEEYDCLPGWRRFLERHYRSLWGFGNYYLFEYWIKHLMFPSRAERAEMKRPKTYLFDLFLVTLYLTGMVAFIVTCVSSPAAENAGYFDGWTFPAILLIVGLGVPFLVWNWIMGFFIFQHHNHPRVAWFIDRNEWDFFAGQVECTTHIVLPWWMELVTGHIMQHTAHHVDSKIPLYRLTGSQSCLESAYPQDIVVEKWTITTLGKTLARCKLYDYENHRWLNFRGKATSEPNPAMRALRQGTAPSRRQQPVKTV
jgi:omega-6 fatty acid desaturase (delta-12 desaturase)